MNQNCLKPIGGGNYNLRELLLFVPQRNISQVYLPHFLVSKLFGLHGLLKLNLTAFTLMVIPVTIFITNKLETVMGHLI